MPDLVWNRDFWDQGYDWAGRGEEWSEAWGGSEAQWFGSLLPRLHRALPANAILEIAPGFGRWTRFLMPACREYLGIDLSVQCIDACRDQFSSVAHARFAANDGLSLAAAPQQHFDLVFSFDSLVHAELPVLQAYVPQVIAKLAKGGLAFIHHSNLRAVGPNIVTPHARAVSVSGQAVAEMIVAAGGTVLVQEIIAWADIVGHDALTLFGRAADFPKQSPRIVQNVDFMREAELIRTCQAPWTNTLPLRR